MKDRDNNLTGQGLLGNAVDRLMILQNRRLSWLRREYVVHVNESNSLGPLYPWE